MRWLIALLLLAFAVPAAAKPTVNVTVTRGEGGEWVVSYMLTRRSPMWVFPRSNPGIDGKPWRQQGWTVETPGVKLERIGNYDVLTGMAGLTSVRIRMRPFPGTLSADYSPALHFSDGGLAFFVNHFFLAPVADRAIVEKMPVDFQASGVPEVRAAITFVDPGRRLLHRGRARQDQVYTVPAPGGEYIYTGDTRVLETPAFAGVIDPGLPAWVRAELDGFTPKMMQFYTDKLGVPGGGKPMAMVAWQGAAGEGWSMGGSVLPGMVVMQLSGKQVLNPIPQVMPQLRWFLGHESAHFWFGQTIAYEKREDGWITEGGADFAAIRATAALAPDYDARAALQAGLDECLALLGPDEPLSQAEERGEHRAFYGCGAMLMLAAESATWRKDPKADSFTWLRALIDANRQDGIVTSGDWLKHFSTVAPDAVGAVRSLLEDGVADPPLFWAWLLKETGVAVSERDGKLVLD